MTTHQSEVANLRRVEGQVRGIIRMIEEGRYCIDILLQLSAVRSALSKVGERVLESHIRGCVVKAIKGKNRSEQEKKIREVIEVLTKFRRGT